MKLLSGFLFAGWVAALLLLGGAGIFTGAWELRHLYLVDLASMSPTAQGNLLNQYRFLKASELGFGLFCVLFRREIFTLPRFNRLFLTVVFLGVGARVLSIVADGWPHWSFSGFTLYELLTGVVVALHSRKSLERA